MKKVILLMAFIALIGLSFNASATLFSPVNSTTSVATRPPNPASPMVSRQFLAGDAIMYTNSGAGAIITNQAGSTNISVFKHQPMGVSTASGTFLTNILVNPYQWWQDTAAGLTNFYKQTTGSPGWVDVEGIPTSVSGITNDWVISIAKSGASAVTTNTDVFVFYPTKDGYFYNYDAALSVSFITTGTNVTVTNVVVPAAFRLGTRGVRMEIQSGTNTVASSNFLHSVTLNALGR